MRAARAEPEVQVHRRIDGRRAGAQIHRLVAARGDPLDHGAEIERDDVDEEADFLQLVANDRRGALAIRAAFLRDQGESRRLMARVLEHAVAVAVGQADRGQQLFGARRIVRRVRNLGRVPLLVGGRDRAVDGHAGAEVDRVGEELPVHGHRNGAAQLVFLQPGRARILAERARLQVDPEGVGVVPLAEVQQLDLAGVRLA